MRLASYSEPVTESEPGKQESKRRARLSCVASRFRPNTVAKLATLPPPMARVPHTSSLYLTAGPTQTQLTSLLSAALGPSPPKISTTAPRIQVVSLQSPPFSINPVYTRDNTVSDTPSSTRTSSANLFVVHRSHLAWKRFPQNSLTPVIQRPLTNHLRPAPPRGVRRLINAGLSSKRNKARHDNAERKQGLWSLRVL